MRGYADNSRSNLSARLGRTIFGGTLIIVALTAIPYGTVDPWWESVFEAAVFAIVILCLIEAAIIRSTPLEQWRLLYPLFAIAGLAVVQSITWGHRAGGAAMEGTLLGRALSADPFETCRFAFKLLATTLCFAILLRHTSNPVRFRLLVFMIVSVALASALFGLARTVLTHPVFSRLNPDRSFGQFENRNHFALLMEIGIGVILGLGLSQRHRRLRLVACVLAGLVLWTALLLTHSRGAVVSLMVEIPFFFLLYSIYRAASGDKGRVISSRSFSPLKKIGLAGLLLATVAASVVLIGGDQTIDHLRETPDEFAQSIDGTPKVARPEIWQATLKLIRHNPVMGVGFAAYPMAISKYLESSPGKFNPLQAHNDYLEVLASGGIVAGSLFAWFLIGCVRQIRARLQSRDPNLAVRCGACAGLFAIGVHSLFDFGLHITVNALACMALIIVAVKSVAEKPVSI
ncbi:MAG TPA: O-antigen ligase family protein [Pyrinomonadaceae bacterium]|nr:O-antigen ligase family protein [Pyrinomonadaceae bacterium]